MSMVSYESIWGHQSPRPVAHRTPADWDAVFMTIAKTVAARSKDPSTQCGAVLVDDARRVLATGFNGPPPQLEDAAVPWHARPDKYRYILHAEENALLFALDAHGLRGVEGSTLYVNGFPCAGCMLRLIRAGVACVKYTEDARPVCVEGDAVRQQTWDVIGTQKHPRLVLEQLTNWGS